MSNSPQGHGFHGTAAAEFDSVTDEKSLLSSTSASINIFSEE